METTRSPGTTAVLVFEERFPPLCREGKRAGEGAGARVSATAIRVPGEDCGGCLPSSEHQPLVNFKAGTEAPPLRPRYSPQFPTLRLRPCGHVPAPTSSSRQERIPAPGVKSRADRQISAAADPDLSRKEIRP
jgi:hypothetical protein